MAPGKLNTSTMEGTTLTLPKVAGWAVQIGDLWDCRTSKEVSGNIFRQNEIEKEDYLEIVPVHDMRYTMSRTGNTNDKSELLDISVEVKIELPQITVEGGVSFRKEDVKNYQQEQFYCQYNVQTSVLRTRASVQDPKNADTIIDEKTMKEIIDGKTATHYVSEIRYGGWATASFVLSNSMKHNLLDLSGYVGGVMPIFAGISVGLKASIGFLDSNTSESFSKKIEITSAPAIKDVEIPQNNVAEMFKYVERIPDAINKTNPSYPPPPDTRIKGVPISFRLSPLPLLFKLADGYETYDLFEAELLQELQDMIFTLHDFQTPNHYITLLSEKDPRLVIMLPENRNSANPWALPVLNFQTELHQKAAELSDLITTTLFRYKKREASIDDLKDIIAQYNSSPLFPPTLKQILQSHVTSGKSILNILRLADSTVANQTDLFVFGKMELDDLLLDNRSITLILYPGGDVIPPGIFMKLYSMTEGLVGHLNFKVRIAAPNIVDDFYVGLKIKSFPIQYFREIQNITKIFELLSVILSSILRKDNNTSKFYSVVSFRSRFGSPANWDMDQLSTYASIFRNEFSQKQIFCADNYLRFLEILTQPNNSEYTFVIPFQFLNSMRDSYFYLEGLIAKIISSKKGITFRTIIAYFDAYQSAGEAPLLYVMDKYGTEVIAVAFDQLDFRLIQNFIINGIPLKDSCVGVKSMAKFPLEPLKIDLGLELYSLLDISPVLTTVQRKECPFLVETNNIGNLPNFIEATKVIELATFSPVKELVGYISIKVANFYGSKMIVLLNDHSWSQQYGFTSEEEPDWVGFVEGLTNFKNSLGNSDSEYPEEAGKYLDILIVAGQYADNPMAIDRLKQVCRFYIDKFFNNLEKPEDPENPEEPENSVNPEETENPEDPEKSEDPENPEKPKNQLHLDISKMLDTMGNSDYLDYLLQALRSLNLARFNENYYKLWAQLDGLKNFAEFDNPQVVLQVLRVVAEFSDQEKEWVWGNPKFQYWTGLVLKSKSVLAKIHTLFTTGESKEIPLYFPSEHTRYLLQVGELLVNPKISWAQNWESVNQMVATFGGLIVKGIIPVDFTSILRMNLDRSPPLKDILKEKGVLFYWEEVEQHFTCGWGMAELITAFEALREKDAITKIQVKPIEKNTIKSLKNEGESFIEVNDKWQIFLKDGLLRRMSFSKWHSLREQPSPQVPFVMMDPLEFQDIGESLLAYIWEQVKQGNTSSILNGAHIFQYIDYPTIKSEKIQQSRSTICRNWTLSAGLPIGMMFSPTLSCFKGNYAPLPGEDENHNNFLEGNGINFFFSRANLQTLLLSSADFPVRSELFKIMAIKSPDLHALPWFIPNIEKSAEEDEFLSFTQNLEQLDLSEYFSENNSPKITKLLRSPFKLITAIRVGQFDQSNFGKSTILNQVFLKFGKFSSKFEPGFENGSPIDGRSGVVELSWFSEFTAESSFYDKIFRDYLSKYEREMVLVANLHGDLLQTASPELIQTLKHYSGAFLLFWGCNSWNEMISLKPKIDEVLGQEVKIYNLVIDPDHTIRRAVSDACIIETGGDFRPKVENMMVEILNGIDPHKIIPDSEVDNPSDNLLNFIRQHSIQTIRSCLKYQNGDNFEPNPVIRDKVLALFMNLISIPDEAQRNTELWRVSHALEILSKSSGQSALEQIASLTTTTFPRITTDIAKSQISSSLRAARHQYNFSTLSLTNLFREVSLDGESYPNYYEILSSIFLKGFPLEFLNLSFFPTGSYDSGVMSCFETLNSLALKFLTVSVIGPQGSGKSSLLNKLFGPAFTEGQFGQSNGIQMRLVHLDKVTNRPESLGHIDAILLLDTEGFSRTGNVLDEEASQHEKQMAILSLSLSDFCILTCNGDSETDWFARLQGILEISFFTECSLFENPSFPDMIIVDDLSIARGLWDNNEIMPKVKEMLKSVNNIVATNPVEMRMKYSMIQRIKRVYTRTFGNSLIHHVPTIKNSSSSSNFHLSLYHLRKMIFSSLGSSEVRPDFLSRASTNLQTILGPESQNLLFVPESASGIQTQLNVTKAVSDLKKCYETVFSAHEDLLEIEGPTSEDKLLDFSTLNGIPYFCTREDKEDCYCEKELANLEAGEGDLLFHSSQIRVQLVMDDLDRYVHQLRWDIMTRMSQEMYATELLQSVIDGHLHTKLKQIIDHPDSWNEFKQHVSTLLSVGPWKGMIDSEIVQEYGPEMLELVKTRSASRDYELLTAFDLTHIGLWNQSPLDLHERIETLGEHLKWEEFIWLEVKVEQIIRTANFTGNGYKRGMLRVIREDVDALLGIELKEKLPSELDYLPSFIREVHILGVLSYVEFWEGEWSRWLERRDPLKLLIEREDKFPDELFIGEEEN